MRTLKRTLLILFLCQTKYPYAQLLSVGTNVHFYADGLPPDAYGSVTAGVAYTHFQGGLEFTNCMGYRPTSYQLLGGYLRGNLRPIDKNFNVFFELHVSSQISGKRTGTALDHNNYLPIQENSMNDQGYRFKRANSQSSLCLGISGKYNNMELSTSFGVGNRFWTSYNINDTDKIYEFGTIGLMARVGICYYIKL